MLKRSAVLIVFCMVFGGLSPRMATAQTPPLEKTAAYWEALIQISYPAAWPPPVYTVGQMLLAPDTAAALQGQITGPVIVIRLIDPIHELLLPKDATFEEIAISLILTPGRNFQLPDRQETTFAGLSGAFVRFEARTGNDESKTLFGIATVAMLPDGRYVAMVFTVPADQWSGFLTTWEAISASVKLLTPSSFPAPKLDQATPHTFRVGGLRFALPATWTESAVGEQAMIYTDPTFPAYADQSGYNSGPLIVLQALPVAPAQTVATALTELAALTPEESAKIATLEIDGVRGAQVSFADAGAGQTVTLTAIPSRDGRVLNVFRFTAPEVLSDVLKPFFERVLASVRLN